MYELSLDGTRYAGTNGINDGDDFFFSLKGIQQAYPDYIKIFEGELT